MSLSKSFFKTRLGLPKSKAPTGPSSVVEVKEKNFTPIHWSKFFYAKAQVPFNLENDDDVFTIYRASGSLIKSPQDVVENKTPVVFFIHGAGYSALTWGPTAKAITEMIGVEAIAVDLRGHGETKTSDDSDLSIGRLTSDIIQVVKNLSLENNPITLVGHSLGGALVVHTALQAAIEKTLHIVGIIVIDVVEGTALESLNSMHSILRNRPGFFKSLSSAVEWCSRSGLVKNVTSARVSIPGQLKHTETNEPATFRVYCQSNMPDTNEVNGSSSVATSSAFGSIPEEGSWGMNYLPSVLSLQQQFTWRVNLKETEKFWFEWFNDLSSKFLEVRCPKFLLLAGMDRMDRTLTVAHMQGKFQMAVIPNVGHIVHEDSPSDVAGGIVTFMVHHKIHDPYKTQSPRTREGSDMLPTI